MQPITRMLTMNEAVEILKIEKPSILAAIRRKKICPVKQNGLWYFSQEELEEYNSKKYVRDLNRRVKSDRVFDESKNHYSVPAVANMYGVSRNRIYQLVRKKLLNTFRVGSTYVVIIEDKIALQDVIVKKNKLN